jgi:hypothetical protein
MLVTSLIFHQNQKEEFFYEAQTAGNLLRERKFLLEAPKKNRKKTRKKRQKTIHWYSMPIFES